MKETGTFKPWIERGFWLVFTVMLIAQFGFRSNRALHVSTICAAILVSVVVLMRLGRRRRVSA